MCWPSTHLRIVILAILAIFNPFLVIHIPMCITIAYQWADYTILRTYAIAFRLKTDLHYKVVELGHIFYRG
jgi:hypothetical protein